MRILCYNWVDYLDPEGRGGGVSVYQAGLMRALAAQDGVTARFLCAGLEHGLWPGRPRWAPVAGAGPLRYRIVDSGCLSPAHASFGDPAQIGHGATERAFAHFLEATGPYDAVHFNNLEGLPARVLALRRRFPETRFVLSLHNHYPFCPQVNFWADEAETCRDDRAGTRCVTCLPRPASPALTRMAYAIAGRLKRMGLRPGSRGFDAVFGPAMRAARAGARLRRARRGPAGPEAVRQAAAGMVRRRAEFVRLINAHCDAVLCVSERVKSIAASHGIAPGLLRTMYIGSEQAAAFDRAAPRGPVPRADGTMTLGYLGYMRRDKGFFFLLDALEALPPDMRARLRLVVAARAGPEAAMARLRAVGRRLAGMVHLDGYRHADLDGVLAEVDVGVVPVLWEDNLPQVALEMHARRVPLLTSDLGGARELARCPAMVFRAGDAKSFAGRMRFLLDGRLDTDRYWRGATAPRAMPDHVADLLRVYAPPRRCGAAAG